MQNEKVINKTKKCNKKNILVKNFFLVRYSSLSPYIAKPPLFSRSGGFAIFRQILPGLRSIFTRNGRGVDKLFFFCRAAMGKLCGHTWME